MAAAAALTLAATYLPSVITYIRQLRRKDGTVVTTVTIIEKLDEADAQFQDNIAASEKWFAAHGFNPDGSLITPGTGTGTGGSPPSGTGG